MTQSRRISSFTTAGIFIAIISLVMCTMILNTSYSSAGIAEEYKVNFSYKLKNPSTVFLSNEQIKIVNKPTIKDNELTYSVNLNQIEDYTQFTFEIENTGNVAIKVKDIFINYPEEFKQYASINVDGISVNDVIQPGATYSNIKVITKYVNGFYNENLALNSLLLDNVKISLEFYE